MPKIEFKSNLPKTIYTDIVGMPDPMLLGLTIHYYNHSDQNLYMKFFGDGPSPWSSGASELGLLNSGDDDYVDIENIMSRTRPSSATTETVTLTLRGYSDAGYSTLVYEFARTTTVIFVKSDDGSWTTDYDDDFDAGSLDSWTVYAVTGTPAATIGIATDYVLSTPNSARLHFPSGSGSTQREHGFRKSITTPNRTTVYGIVNLRTNAGTERVNRIRIYNDSTVIIHLGKNDWALSNYVPIDKWMRIVFPLPINSTFNLNIPIRRYRTVAGFEGYFWLDDFKVISKN